MISSFRPRWAYSQTVEATVDLRTPPGSLWRAITDHESLPRHVSMLRRGQSHRGFQKSVGFWGLARHRFFNETKDYRPQWPGKQHKREKLSALPQPTDQPRKVSRSATLQPSSDPTFSSCSVWR